MDFVAGGRVRIHEGFATLDGSRGVGWSACAAEAIANATLSATADQVQHELGTDAQFVVFLAEEPLPCSHLFYIPVANDVTGIGYRHERVEETFRDAPGLALEGIVFLNDWPYWDAHPAELDPAFAHELGHRWGSRIHANLGGLESAALLGRQGRHWSYFLDTGGSPLEGNAWFAAGQGRFASATHASPSAFSQLDLYLMGLIEAHDVPPTTLLVEPHSDAVDCEGRPLSDASPPQACGALTVTAQARQVDIRDILAAEGPRDPPARATLEIEIFVALLVEDGASMDRGECEAIASALDGAFRHFEMATGDRILLRNPLLGRGDCTSLDPEDSHPMNAGCRLAAPSSWGTGRFLIALFGLYPLSRSRQTRTST